MAKANKRAANVSISSKKVGTALKLISTEEALTRSDLTKKLDVSKMTSTNIVNYLLDQGIIELSGQQETSNGGGPRADCLSIKGDRLLSLGISVTPKHIDCVIADLKHGLIYSQTKHMDPNQENPNISDQIVELIYSTLDHLPINRKHVIGIGVVICGLVSEGQLFLDKRLIALRALDIAIRDRLEEEFDLPVFMENNMNASAVAEYLFGQYKNIPDFFYMGIGEGVGGGVFNHDVLVKGDSGFASEIGHITIQTKKEQCLCGNYDCAELYCSINTLIYHTQSRNWDHFIERFNQRDKSIQKVLDEYVDNLVNLLVTVIHIYDPAFIVIGDSLCDLGDWFFSNITSQVNQRIIWRDEKHIPIFRSIHKNNAPLAGSYAIVFDHFFRGEITLK